MARPKCAICAEPQTAKMSSWYWAWTWPTGDRRGYVQLICKGCITDHVKRLIRYAADDTCCVLCRGPLDASDSATVWLTLYAPGRDREDLSLEYHPSCFESEADVFSRGARRLPDREGAGSGGPPAPRPREEWPSWSAMGIDPA